MWRVFSVKLLEEARKALGEKVELLHDMHDRYTPNHGRCSSPRPWSPITCSSWKIRLSPEDLGYFHQIRQQCATPISHGRALQ